MVNSFIAEIDKLIRRPATWVLVAVWGTAALFFAYVIPYTSYANPSSSLSVAARQALLARMLPEQLVSAIISGFPVFGGAIALVFGTLVVGSEYGWGTLKTVLVQRPGRLPVTAGTLLALAVMELVFVLAVFVLGAVGSFIVASVENAPVVWPSAWDFVQGLGAAWLILTMWAMLGAMLATLLRGATLALGLGLFYLLIERLLAGFSNLSDLIGTISKALPGSNAGSLAAALAPSSTTPGVAAVVGTTQSLLVLVAYLAGFVLLNGLLVLKRDVL